MFKCVMRKLEMNVMRALLERITAAVIILTAGCWAVGLASAANESAMSDAQGHLKLAARADSTVVSAIGLAVDGQHDRAQALKAQIKDPATRTLIDWLYVRSSKRRAGFDLMAEFMADHPDWPQIARIRAHAEAELFARPQAPGRALIHFKAYPAETGFGMLAHARALLRTGKPERAGQLIRTAWREHDFGKNAEPAILKEFRKQLSGGDHRARLVRLIYARKNSDAARTAALISPDHVKMAKAAAALFSRSRNAIKHYQAVPQNLRDQLVMKYALANYYRRKGQSDKARQIVVNIPGTPRELSYPRPWWQERWSLIRSALRRDSPKSWNAAYRMAKAHGFEEGTLYVQGEFMSGWIALQFLKKPKTAIAHLKLILERDRKPLNLAQANYWLARAYGVLGDVNIARKHFNDAAAFPTTFYGQLALDALGRGTAPIKIVESPAVSGAAKARFDRNDQVRAIRLLVQAKKRSLLPLFFNHLAQQMEDDEQRVALAGLARDLGEIWLSVRVAKVSSRNGVGLDRFAYPKDALPKVKRSRKGVERALVYAISRQESEFNARAVSHAGARGLMQMMPTTARRVSKKHGLRYRKAHLLSNPAYNVTLGTAFLGDLLEKFNGSYIATIAGYNAGPGRIPQWNKWYGDPHKGQIDPVDWIESIPFNETRNYVKRVMENVQVYRTLFGETQLVSLTTDLRRGGSKQTQAATPTGCQTTEHSTIEQLIACN